MIGYDTNCCQHLRGAGETAMIYGLANPDAGFFVIEDKTSGKILAQAEAWQTADGGKLVFDNIEFADDRQIDQFAPVLAKWCEEAPYPDVLMGNGYNEMEMVNDNIRQFAGMTPPLTGDLLVILDNDNIVGFLNSEYEEKYPNLCDLYEAIAAGEVNTKDLLEEIAPYTDADESCSVLKYSNSVELYFQEAYDNYVKEHGELPEIGSFFSEPSEEDLLAFSRENLSTKDAYVMVSGSRLKDLEDEHEATAPEVTGRCEDMADTREDYDDIDEYL